MFKDHLYLPVAERVEIFKWKQRFFTNTTSMFCMSKLSFAHTT